MENNKNRRKEYDRTNTEYGAYFELLNKLDANEPFMRGGHKVVQPRHQVRVIPDWALDDARVREIILRSFPKLTIDPKQRARAARWVRVIFLYFRREFTEGQIAEFLGSPNEDGSDIVPIPITQVRSLIRAVKRAAAGLRAKDGAPRKRVPRLPHILKGDKDQENL